jgi:hypothetical protein|nr:MAG TPA: hypothetical protein [Caudoviricetes sp.]
MLYNNTNIRYHIFKELLKHRREINKTNLDRINDFAIPVFSGISTALLATSIQSIFFEDTPSGFLILFYIIAPALLYLITYKISQYAIIIYKNKIFPYLWQTKISNSNDIEEEKERTAKFDYEVNNLVRSSYTLIRYQVKDEILNNYNLMLSIFYANNAIKDLEKSLLPQEIHVSSNRIMFVLHMLREAINLQIQREYKKKTIFHDEILNVISSYNSLIETLNNIYKLNIDQIETLS